jgi:hypothetical protein
MQRVPIRYEMRARTGLIIAGAVMLGGAWLMTAGVGAFANSLSCSGTTSCSGVYWPLYVPLVGPFMELGLADKYTALDFSPALVLSGLAQLAGLSLIIAGAVAKHRVPVYASAPSRLTVSPYFTPMSSGLVAVGSF